MQNSEIDVIECERSREERCQQLSEIYQYVNSLPVEIRENPCFMGARSLSEAAVDSIV